MERTYCIHHDIPDGPRRPSGTLLRWGALAAWMALIWLFVFVVAPAVRDTPSVKPMADYIRERGIDASALYYTEVEETGEAEAYLRDALATER